MVTIEIFKTNVATVMIVLLASADVLEAPVLENCHRGVSINLLASVILCEKEVNSLGNFFSQICPWRLWICFWKYKSMHSHLPKRYFCSSDLWFSPPKADTMTGVQKPKCRSLILDAGPLLSLSPLRGLASIYYTTPQVLAELKDNRAREHFEKLGLLSGVKVVVKSPDAMSLTNGEFFSSFWKIEIDVRIFFFSFLWVYVQ